MPEILPCPFCGETPTISRPMQVASGHRMHAYCKSCGSMSGTGANTNEAIEIWNRRATPPDAVTLRDAAQAVLDWYDRDGSVGGAVDPIEALRAALSGKGE